MDEPIQLDETGFVTIKLGDVERPALDLFAMYNRLIEIRDDTADKPASAFNAAVAEYMIELGFPTVSHQTAVKFAGTIWNRVAELKKKEPLPESASPTPSSPDSTDSQSGD